MSAAKHEPSEAEMLAMLITRSVDYGHVMATVQRSHRFPVHLLAQMESMARMGQVPVSVIINQVIECGLEAVKERLPPDVVRELSSGQTRQADRATETERIEIKGQRAHSKPRLKRAK
jgi:hypothetical protein